MVPTTYATAGNTALKGRTSSHLTLVYDASVAGAGHTYTHAAHHEVKSLNYRKMFACMAALVTCALVCSLAVSTFKGTNIARVLDEAVTEEVRVTSGDTIWSIADQCVGDTVPTYDAVEWICSRNDLNSPVLKPGQRLVVPMLQ